MRRHAAPLVPRLPLGLALLVALALPPGIHATVALDSASAALHEDPIARALLDRFKAASGGAAWDRVRTLHTRGIVSTGGLRGRFESWEELATGRSLSRFELGPVRGAEGYDGDAPWSQDPAGEVTVVRSEEALEMARNEAYRTSLAWWYPERWPARVRTLGERQEADSRFALVEMTPRGGRPFELWLDPATALPVRAVERGGIETLVTTFEEWRQVGPVRLPFRVRTGNGEPRYDTVVQVEAIEIDTPVDAALFTPPRSRAADFGIAGEATRAVLPFTLRNNHVYLQVAIDGHEPVPMLLDSGGFNVLTPEAAKRLGIHGQGALQGRGVGQGSTDVAIARVGAVQVGPVAMRDQVFYLLPLSGMEDAEGTPVAGVLGFELLQRFVVEIDYDAQRVTFVLPESFTAASAGTALPFVFADHMPAVEGSLDGVAGRFTIDTGSRGGLTLHRPFVERHGLVERYRPSIEATTGWGVGGAVRAQVTRAGVLRLGPLEVPRPVTELVIAEKGALTDRYLAGNVGGGILRRFRVTFDYRHERLYLAPGEASREADPYDRAGLWLVSRGETLEVEDVIPGAPGPAAGIYPGDRLTSLPSGRAPAPPAAELRERLRHDPPGTRVPVRVHGRGGRSRDVTLELRDLAPAQEAAATPAGQLTPVPPMPQ